MKKIHINNDNDYCTPPDLYDKLNKCFNFDFDPCPYRHDLNKWDGLTCEWGKVNFINPPYSLKEKTSFVLKAIDESKKGKVCVMLLNSSTGTKLYHRHIKPNATHIIELEGRLKFGKLDKNGKFYLPLSKHGKKSSGTKDSVIIVFDGRFNNLISELTS